MFTGSRIEYLPISEIIKWKEFYIIHEDTPFSRRQLYNYGNIDDIYSELNKPLVLQNRGKVAYFILDIFKDKKYHIEIRTSKKHWFFFIRTNQVSTSDYKFLNYRYEKYTFDKPHICAYTNFALERIFNTDHEIISYFINNASEITKSQRKYKLFEEFFKDISHFMYKIHSSTFNNF